MGNRGGYRGSRPGGGRRPGGRPGGRSGGFRPGGPGAPIGARTAVPTVPLKREIEFPDTITVRELATLINVSPINIIRELMNNGIMANINQQLDFDAAAIVSEAFNVIAKQKQIVVTSIMDEIELHGTAQPSASTAENVKVTPRALTLKQRILAKEGDKLAETRPPVVTIMGHVDHGKTSLLDAIRKANVAGGEAGGITQHIGAYQVDHEGKKITFIDTPGHAAFTAMRARGANITDVAVLVVAADDGVMPQTKEAIQHAKAAGVPIVVALNKIDRPNANPDKVKGELAEHGLTPDDWGGDTLVVPVSAKNRTGIEDLLEGILLTAESLDSIRANSNTSAVGTVVEAELDKNKGAMATVLVQNGTLNLGDAFVAGSVYGKVRAMFDFRGHRIKQAKPSQPVSILGMSEVPAAGDIFEVFADDRAAKAVAAQRGPSAGRSSSSPSRAMSLDEYFAKAKEGTAKKLLLVVKTENQGSLPPLIESLNKLSVGDGDEVGLQIIGQGTGQVTERDVDLAIASGAVILAFEASMDGVARKKAEANKIDVREYNIIYKLLEDIEKALKGMLPKRMIQRVVGTAEVKQLFRVSKYGQIAGCLVKTGMIARNNKARVIRAGKNEFTGTVNNLKRLTEDAKEVRAGLECGISLHDFENFMVADMIEFYVEEEEDRS